MLAREIQDELMRRASITRNEDVGLTFTKGMSLAEIENKLKGAIKQAKLRSEFHTGGDRGHLPKCTPEAAKKRLEARNKRKALKQLKQSQ